MSTSLAAAGPSVQEVAATQSSAPSVDLSQHPSGIVPVLQNIVATVNLTCKLDLKQIALRARNAEYNPKVILAHHFLVAYSSSSFRQAVVMSRDKGIQATMLCSVLLLSSSASGTQKPLL